MQEGRPSGDRGPLERLCGDEAELERSLEEARREAAGVISGARAEAERIAAEARAALEAELARARVTAESALDLERIGSREAVDVAVAALARVAERNRPHALKKLVEIVLRGGAP